MKTDTPVTIKLEDYRAPDFLIKTVNLTFWLGKEQTIVESVLEVQRNNPGKQSLVLNGEELELMAIELNGRELGSGEYELQAEQLVMKCSEDEFIVKIRNKMSPVKNTALDGLYVSGSILCTQNEPEGFRRITYFVDRPDVMSIYTTTLIGDKNDFPIMLSNGNLIESGEMDDGKHFCVWNDPFAKPCYLYAIVAGDLGLVQDRFVTMSGREIDLRIYCDKGNEDKCQHAMVSLQKSMKWDEERFGLEYDLDIYMIVAVDSFNMGAMENKGLNIFNSAYVLARPDTATDDNFHGIESVIGHEYFHNWTGNRITCRDWFQLTLKEGLTVYRDQEFSADLNSRPVERVKMVQGLRARQFIEDAGPTAHPIKPKTYIEINNFYSSTVYEKGAEVIRMIATLLGKAGFRRGMDKYFELYDGQAVTTEDFIHAMSVANNNYDFSQFMLWYDQAGTPELKVHFDQNLEAKTVTLTIAQTCPPTPGQLDKRPFHLPFALGLVNEKGHDLPLSLQNSSNQPDLNRGLLHLRKTEETFVFTDVEELVTPSLNRDFSAPVNVHSNLTLKHKIHLAKNDSNAFLRYEMLQEIYHTELERLRLALQSDQELTISSEIREVFQALLGDKTLDPQMKALLLELPAETILHQRQAPIDIASTYGARTWLQMTLAENFQNELMGIYSTFHDAGEFKLHGENIGKRALKNIALEYLANLIEESPEVERLLTRQYNQANNMTDQLKALALIHHNDGAQSTELLRNFYEQWKHETLVIQKWFALQASHPGENTYGTLEELEKNPAYDKTMPNCVRAIWRQFTANSVQFHHPTGRGYQLMAKKIEEVDAMNPQLASGLASGFRLKPKLPTELQSLMEQALRPLLERPGVSKNVFEVISKILN
jgi:aminopeptidase N